MSSMAMSLKAKIKKYAKNNNIAAQVVLQNYMFERFLVRMSKSQFRENFIVKGGLLIASIVGLNTRSTMDLDATLKNISLTDENVLNAIKSICSIDLKDGITFNIVSISSIRDNDKYGGVRVKLNSKYDTIVTPLSIDVSTGDVITPAAMSYEFCSIFNEDEYISLLGYNIETVLAEKAETILSRGIFNTRPRDFYDIYILCTTKNYNVKLFNEALVATAKHRGTVKNIKNAPSIIASIQKNEDLRDMWKMYQTKFAYSENITYEQIIAVLQFLLQ